MKREEKKGSVICGVRSMRLICSNHDQTKERGVIQEHGMDNWGKNNDFHIVFLLTFYKRFAGSHCWILVDHATVGVKYVFFMFLQSIEDTWIQPFALKVR